MIQFEKLFTSALASEQTKDLAIRIAAWLPRSVQRILVQAYANRQAKMRRLLRGPSPLFYFVTNRCNLRCRHCFYASELSKDYDELDLGEVRKVARSLKGTVSSIILCGGEPFMRKDIADLAIAFAEEGGIKDIAITTNGFFLDQIVEGVKAFMAQARSGLRVVVSLDGPADVHNTIRRNPKAFAMADQTIRALERMALQDDRLKVIINAVVSVENIDIFPAFYRDVRENYHADFTFTFLRQDARDVQSLDRSLLWSSEIGPNLLPDSDRCRKLLDDLRTIEKSQYLFTWRAKVREYHLQGVERCKSLVACTAPDAFGTLYPDGGMSICEVVQPFANVREFDYDVLRCWTSDAAGRQRGMLRRCSCTYPCALVDSMSSSPQAMLDVLADCRRLSRRPSHA